MADPVSWLLIEPGWAVQAADGSDLGRVLEVAGDSGHDIFDGLAVSSSALGEPKYVPAEEVGEIVEGSVRLSLDANGFGSLAPWSEPAEEVEVEGEKAPIVDRVETELAPPDHRGEIGLIRRVALWLGLAGRR
jgi:hypothetical protein